MHKGGAKVVAKAEEMHKEGAKVVAKAGEMLKGGVKGVIHSDDSHGRDEDSSSIDRELQPGGMPVQKREPDGPLIEVKVSHGLFAHDISVPAQATFGDLKKLLVQDTTLQPDEMRLIFRGKIKDDSELLHVAGVKDKAKIMLVEDPSSRERRVEATRKEEQVAEACKAVRGVHSEVDKLAGKIEELEGSIVYGTAVAESEFVVLSELLMRQILTLDGIEADGEAKELRKAEVKRVQGFTEAVDRLKARNAKLQAPPS